MDHPDYELEDTLVVDSAEQHRALGNLTRHRILGLLLDRAMTGAQLAEALDVLKGSVSFHLRALERAGLVRVVRTRPVRGVTERYYGRTARRYELDRPGSDVDAGPMLLRTVADEAERVGPAGSPTDMITTTRARLDPAGAADFRDRLGALVEEFRAAPGPATPAYTLAVAFFRSEPEARA
ncbi:MAG: ArsR family transcriptional regulator [Mycobacteriales bacterium]